MGSEKLVKCPICGEEVNHTEAEYHVNLLYNKIQEGKEEALTEDEEERLRQYRAYPGTDPNVTPRQVLTAVEESIERLDESDLVSLHEQGTVHSDDPENSG